MTKTAIEEGLRNFLITEVFYDKVLDADALAPNDSLVGMLDSLGIMRVVSFLRGELRDPGARHGDSARAFREYQRDSELGRRLPEGLGGHPRTAYRHPSA
jgi:hypothetical protein